MMALIIGRGYVRRQENRWHTNPELWEKLKSLAYEKRHKPTEAENELWQYLRMHKFQGLKFRRQHCLGPFIADFYCKDAKLVIEVDGPIHQYKPEEDAIRQEYLESLKLKVLRFSNEMVLTNTKEVLKQIETSLPGTLQFLLSAGGEEVRRKGRGICRNE